MPNENKAEIIENKIKLLLDEWQNRWDETEKGRWSYEMIPDIRWRYRIPMACDHYTTWLLTGHGDIRGRLHNFKLVDNPNCRCGQGSETVRHVLLACPRVKNIREKLKRTLMEEGEAWPPICGIFLKTKKLFEAFRLFAKEALTNRSDR